MTNTEKNIVLAALSSYRRKLMDQSVSFLRAGNHEDAKQSTMEAANVNALVIKFTREKELATMTDPCRYCVAPERYPGCHDHCEKLKAHRESDEYKKLCEYKNTYLKSHSTASSSQINKAMRYFKYKGYSLYGFKNVGGV